MASVEELLYGILGVVGRMRDLLSKPRALIAGYKDDIGTQGQRITEKSTPIRKVVVVKVRSLGTGNYIALGTEVEQPYQLSATGDTLDVDFVDDLSKVVVSTDAGNTGALEWIGG